LSPYVNTLNFISSNTAIEDFLAGNSNAVGEVYDKYSAALYGIVVKIVLNTDIAEDVVQETFCKAWLGREKYNATKGSFFTWLLNIARNLAIDILRSGSYKNSAVTQSADLFVGIEESVSDVPISEDSVDIDTHVATLPSEQQQIIQLVYFKGYTQQEIADEFSIPLGTVKSRLRLAMNTLRNIYGAGAA
jgi:RNA polymerase sigma factor (sigma-70 family)